MSASACSLTKPDEYKCRRRRVRVMTLQKAMLLLSVIMSALARHGIRQFLLNLRVALL